jgi:hypothetical protein
MITERKLRRLFSDQGFKVHEIRQHKHWVATVARHEGGLLFNVAVSLTPSDHRFPHRFVQSLRRAERAASSR